MPLLVVVTEAAMNALQRSCTAAALALLMPTSLLAGPSLHARPLPEGRTFFITTAGYDYRITEPATVSYTYVAYDSLTHTNHVQYSGRHMLSSELGIMRNLDPRNAVGFSQYLAWDVENDLHWGLSLRGRRWLSHGKSVDVTAGALLTGTNGDGYNYPGFVGTASMNFDDWEHLRLTVTALPVRVPEYQRPQGSTSVQKTEFGVFLGYQMGGKPGFVVNAAATLLVLIAAAAYAADPL